jgi:hypothetical protein
MSRGHDLEDNAIHSTYSTNTISSGNFSKEILTAIRTWPGVAHGLPRISRQNLNLEIHQLYQ